MADENKMLLAKQVFQTLCDAIERRKWTFEKNNEELVAHFQVSGDDIPMEFILFIDAERQLIRLLSPIPFKINEAKRMEGAVACCAASFGMADGSFDYNLSDGSIVFRMTASFDGCVIGEGLFQYMISCACAMIDKYNDRFLAIDKGLIDISDFFAKNS